MTTTSNPGLAAARARLQQKLEEVFQFDCAELDFGVYRILNVKRAEFTRFLAGELDRVLDQNLGGSPERAARLQELAAIEKTAHDVGLPDATALPKWQKLHAELAAEAGPEELARDVFSHLAEFFSRYYDDGDFLARPRRGNAYAIPYDGSEVKLHWANADQYYIKTTEHFQVYDAEVSTGFTRIHLHFRIAAAENTERDNVKAAEKRYFMLREQAPVEVDGQHVTCWFDYRGADAKTNQAAQNALSQERIAAALPPELRQGLNKPKDTKDPKGRTLLGWHLLQYTEKNKRDFFIHKDLGGFLRQELDFYVKSEVLVLDDLDPADPGKAARVLQKVKTLRALAEPLIVWLAQIEDFQKKLWLKKKFVLAANWCVTLDRVIDKAPELLAEIAGNDLQRAAWVRLCAIDEIAAEKPKGQGGLFGTGGSAGRTGYSEPLTEAFLRENPGLMVDTQFFARPFVQRLQEKGVVSQVDGWALRGENAGVLRTMAETWRSEVQAIYIDPPYNAPASLVLYKNDFKHAAWLSMMNERLTAARQLQSDAGPLVVAIDENEQERLGMLLEQTHPDASRTCVTVVHNPRGIQGDNFAYSHEYAYFVLASGKKVVKPIQVPAAEWEWSSLRNWGGDSTRSFGWTLFYPIYVKDGAIVELGTAPPNEFHPSAGSINLQDGRIEVWPIDNSGVERKWRYARDSLAKRLDSARAVQKNGETQIEIAQIRCGPAWIHRIEESWHTRVPVPKEREHGGRVPACTGSNVASSGRRRLLWRLRDDCPRRA
jgi:adenine-specific DNA-methyltransferase